MTAGRRRTSLAILPESFNRLRDPLQIVGCWSLGGSMFGFSDAYVPRAAKLAFGDFAATHAAHPQAPVAVFGHTDPVGSVTFNHELSSARAQTVYGILRNDPDIWVTLYQDDGEACARLKTQLKADGYELDAAERGLGPTTTQAIVDHVGYLGADIALDVYDFLGEHGQFSMQACSEFNPLRRLGAEIAERCTPEMKSAALATNRRVVAFWFAPGTHVDGAWPCPIPGEGPAKCGRRLWSDAKKRRASQAATREFWPAGVKGAPHPPIARSEETFECRFYDRVAHASPCEVAEPWRPPPEDPIIITDEPDPVVPAPPKPPVPDIPKGPPPPDPPPKVPPKPPAKKKTWVPLVSCSHSSGMRINSGALRSQGKGKDLPKGDVLQVVPDKGGDEITITLEPDAELTNADVYYGMGLVSWQGSGKTSVSATVDHVTTGADHPITLLARFKVKPPSKTVVIEHVDRTEIVTIESFPDKRVAADAEVLLDAIAKAIKPFVKTLEEVGKTFADDFKLEVLEDDATELSFEAEWKEWPLKSEFSGVMDCRAFFSYEAVFAIDPLGRVTGTLDFTLIHLLKRLRRFEWLKKPVDRVLGVLPKFVMDLLESVKLELKPDIGGGGRFEATRDRPDEELLEVSDRKGAEHWELLFDFGLGIEGSATLEELLEGWVDEASVSISTTFHADLMVGMIVDMVKEEYGFYCRAGMGDVDLRVKVGFSLFDLGIDEKFNLFRARRWGPVRVPLA